MTKYNIFVRYYNNTISKSVTNDTKCQWYKCTETEYNRKYLGHYLQLEDMKPYKLEKELETLETLYISGDEMTPEENMEIYKKFITSAATVTNKKYDMFFIWDGLGYYTDPNNIKNQLYFDKMKRTEIKPWFFYCTTSSLREAMRKAEELYNIFGRENVEIGKEVPLKNFVDIV
jgi:hypothetical protein